MRKLTVTMCLFILLVCRLPVFADEVTKNDDPAGSKRNTPTVSGRLAETGEPDAQSIKNTRDNESSGANVRNSLCPKFVHILENSSGCAEIAPQKSHLPDDGGTPPAKVTNWNRRN